VHSIHTPGRVDKIWNAPWISGEMRLLARVRPVSSC
jgi:hypothetical protein